MSLSQRVVLYNALIQPHFDYCASVWSSDSAKVQSDLCTTQRKAVRALYNYSSKVRSDEFRAQNNIQSLNDRWKTQEAIWLYKAINKERFVVPNYLVDLLHLRESTRALRNRTRIDVNCKTALGETTIAIRLRKLLSKLSFENEIWRSDSIISFKNKFMRFLRSFHV